MLWLSLQANAKITEKRRAEDQDEGMTRDTGWVMERERDRERGKVMI